MANHASAKKRHRQSLKRRERNVSRRSRALLAVRKFRSTLEKKDPGAVVAQLSATSSELMKAVTKGIMRKQTASRRVSRMAKAAHKALASIK